MTAAQPCDLDAHAIADACHGPLGRRERLLRFGHEPERGQEATVEREREALAERIVPAPVRLLARFVDLVGGEQVAHALGAQAEVREQEALAAVVPRFAHELEGTRDAIAPGGGLAALERATSFSKPPSRRTQAA